MDLNLLVLITIFHGFLFGVLTFKVAKEKDYIAKNWFFVGFFCGLLGLITAIGLPNKSN